MAEKPIVDCVICQKPGESKRMYGVQRYHPEDKTIEPLLEFAHRDCLEKSKFMGNIFDK